MTWARGSAEGARKPVLHRPDITEFCTCRISRNSRPLRFPYDPPAKLPGEGALNATLGGMLIGYARVSTNTQDLTAQRDALAAAGVDPDAIYVDHGFTGTQRERPGLGKALAACRNGDTLVVTKLDRLARSLPDARDIADELSRKGVALNLGGSIYDPRIP